ncbi:MAG: hypothetical protein NXY57DRAFT_970640 [Lentinula lateritia]|nr:MAG: hypothetical protein NXY57DRAFT_970640 [Lentinula lateritia]
MTENKVAKLGIEPRTFWLYPRCSNQLSYPALVQLMRLMHMLTLTVHSTLLGLTLSSALDDMEMYNQHLPLIRVSGLNPNTSGFTNSQKSLPSCNASAKSLPSCNASAKYPNCVNPSIICDPSYLLLPCLSSISYILLNSSCSSWALHCAPKLVIFPKHLVQAVHSGQYLIKVVLIGHCPCSSSFIETSEPQISGFQETQISRSFFHSFALDPRITFPIAAGMGIPQPLVNESNTASHELSPNTNK